MFRDLLRGFSRPGRRDVRQDVAADPFRGGAVGQGPRSDSELLARIEKVALGVYAAHGLPTRHGHYRWSPRARTWTFLGEHLTPDARWALLLDQPPQAGGRYGTLSDLGLTGVPDVAAAAAVLDACAKLRKGFAHHEGAGPWDEMELAIRLGAQWQALKSRSTKPGKPRPRLTAPDTTVGADAKPAPPRRKPAAKT